MLYFSALQRLCRQRDSAVTCGAGPERPDREAHRYTHVLASEVLLSPILVRPVREQLEHDRVIRLLQAKYKRKFEVAINPGNEQSAPVGGPPPWFPDLVLQTTEKTHKLAGVVEVETAESVNNLEAMSQWVAFSRLRVPFHLYVPAAYIDSTRRLCADLDVSLEELWAYHSIGEQLRFTLVQRTAQPEAKPRAVAAKAEAAAAPAAARPRASARPAAAAAAPRASARPAAAATTRPRPAATAAARRTTAAATPRRPAAAKAKAAAPAPRRAAAKAPRKTAAAPSRAQKRR